MLLVKSTIRNSECKILKIKLRNNYTLKYNTKELQYTSTVINLGRIKMRQKINMSKASETRIQYCSQ